MAGGATFTEFGSGIGGGVGCDSLRVVAGGADRCGTAGIRDQVGRVVYGHLASGERQLFTAVDVAGRVGRGICCK
jgi:hypothetical protein